MNILILGSGGREYALAWKLSKSPKVSNVFIGPSNAGTSASGTDELTTGCTDDTVNKKTGLHRRKKKNIS